MNKSEKIFEPVIMVWDFYDGPRIGLATFKGNPHYFECKFDENLQDFPTYFSLYPVDGTFLILAAAQWEIFRLWEHKYHNGQEKLENHPGHRGVNSTYDKLSDAINDSISNLQKSSGKYFAEFRPLPEQDDLPIGIMKDLEACWLLKID